MKIDSLQRRYDNMLPPGCNFGEGGDVDDDDDMEEDDIDDDIPELDFSGDGGFWD